MSDSPKRDEHPEVGDGANQAAKDEKAPNDDEDKRKIHLEFHIEATEEKAPNEDEDEDRQKQILVDLHFKIRSLHRQHALAYERFRTLERYYHSGPLVLLSLVSGILSFLAAGNKEEIFPGTNSTLAIVNESSPGTYSTLAIANVTDTDDTDVTFSPKVKEILIITVGVLSFFQIAVQKFGQMNDFQSRSKMHHEVSSGLQKLLHKIDFETKKSKEVTTTQMIKTWQEVFEQCLSSCTSAMPLAIKQAYELLESNLQSRMAELRSKRRAELKKSNPEPEADEIFFYRIIAMYSNAFNILYTEISSQCCIWPFYFGSPRGKVDTALKKAMEDIKESKMFSEEFDAKCPLLDESNATPKPQPCFAWRGCKKGSDIEEGNNEDKKGVGNSATPKNEKKERDGDEVER